MPDKQENISGPVRPDNQVRGVSGPVDPTNQANAIKPPDGTKQDTAPETTDTGGTGLR